MRHFTALLREYRDAFLFDSWIELRIARRPLFTPDTDLSQANVGTEYDSKQSEQ